jgi:antitoxin (DNA-binding transcriptional repressor) of toxin-antitoxin stability system
VVKNQTMTKVEFKKVSGPLSEYAEKARKDPIIVIKRGKPFAAVVPIRNADEETVALSTNRKLLKPPPRSREVDLHFDVLRIVKTCKSLSVFDCFDRALFG